MNAMIHARRSCSLFGGPGTQPAFHADYRNRDNGLLYEMKRRSGKREKISISALPMPRNKMLTNSVGGPMGDAPMPGAAYRVPAQADKNRGCAQLRDRR